MLFQHYSAKGKVLLAGKTGEAARGILDPAVPAAFPADHPLHVGMGFGPSSVPAAENAFKRCDAMLAVGTRFAEICTGSYGSVPPRQLVHIDINPDALGRNFPAAVPIHADARDAVPALADALEAAVHRTLSAGVTTADLAGDGGSPVST